MRARRLLALCLATSCFASKTPSVLHYTIERRGGAFPADQVANFTFLTASLHAAEARFNLTCREMSGNKVVRRAKERAADDGDLGGLMGEVGKNGTWFTKLRMGIPEQAVEMDLDMLLSDFYLFTTTSAAGSHYFDFHSQTYQKSNAHPYPTCGQPTETVHLPTIGSSFPITFAHCRPSKSSLSTLHASGSMLGLASSDTLSQTKTPGLLQQLVNAGAIDKSIWSLMLINGHEGVLSIGGTGAEAVAWVEQQTEDELTRFAELEESRLLEDNPSRGQNIKRGPLKEDLSGARLNHEEDWKWTKVQGAKGWWQILMQGVWVGSSRVLKNQPVVIDLNTPFTLAPPAAAKALYSSISGARRMSPPHDQFYTFPCLNPPKLAFEFAGWQFPAMQGGNGAEGWGAPGGRLSLGKMREGSGYCVGSVVETRMGETKTPSSFARKGRRRNGGSTAVSASTMDAGNGLKDVWVLGEGFFRGVSGVFDLMIRVVQFKDEKVGLRTY